MDNRFTLKGKDAEKFVHDLAFKTFLVDWCYPNPCLPDRKELCDLLVVFDDIAIIWQIKDLKLDENRKYSETKVAQNIRQLSGARRQLFDLKTSIELENPRRGKEIFNPTTIKQIYLISVLLGEGEEVFSFVEQIKKYTVHVFTRTFTQIALNELDTISDFSNYLRKKENLLSKNKRLIISGGEEELLSIYLKNNRSFDALDEATDVFLDQGIWEKFRKSNGYQTKKREDNLSYSWDHIINIIHDTSPGYEVVARELARPNRFERRVLGKTLYEAYVLAVEDKEHNVFRRCFSQRGVTYCFLFCDETWPREYRKKMLHWTCYIARGTIRENKKVIGIATEKKDNPKCSYDFALLDMPVWGEQNQKEMEEMQRKTGILLNPTIKIENEDEYPKS